MSLHEAAQESAVIPPPGAMAEMIDHRPATEFEAAAAPDAGTAMAAETQGFRYVRKDGTVEYAASPEEVFKRCSVLGELAMKDPDAANLLLDVASIGQNKIIEEKRSKPKVSQLTEPAAKSPKTVDMVPGRPKPGTDEGDAMTPRPRVQRLEPIETTKRELIELSARASEHDLTVTEEARQESITEKSQKNAKPTTIRARTYETVVRKKPAKREVKVPAQTNSTEDVVQTATKRVQTTMRAQPKRKISPTPSVQRLEASERRPNRPKHKLPTKVAKGAGPAAEVREAKKINKEAPARADEAAVHNTLFVEAKLETREISLAEPVVTTNADTLLEPAESLHEAVEQVAWAETIEQEPATEQASLGLFDTFAEELRGLITAEVSPAGDLNEQPGLAAAEQSANKSEASNLQLESMPAIALAVAEQLEGLEPDQKAVVELTLQKIVEASHPVTILEAGAVRPEAEQVAVEQLKEQVAVLFEQLDLAYGPDDVDQFVKIVSRLNLQPAAPAPAPEPELPEETATDLEHDGTREAKWRLSRLAGGLFSTEYAAEQLLGKLALRFARRQRPDSPAWSYLRI